MEDLVLFLKTHKFEEYLPTKTRTGKIPKYDRDWLLVVRPRLPTQLLMHI